MGIGSFKYSSEWPPVAALMSILKSLEIGSAHERYFTADGLEEAFERLRACRTQNR